MEYHGRLFGKVGNKYFDTGVTSDDYDAALAKIDELAEQVLKLNLHCVSNNEAFSEVSFCCCSLPSPDTACNHCCKCRKRLLH